LLTRVVGRLPVILRDDILQRVMDETISLYRNVDDVKAFLTEVDRGYQTSTK
jgi:hypothetical protein